MNMTLKNLIVTSFLAALTFSSALASSAPPAGTVRKSSSVAVADDGITAGYQVQKPCFYALPSSGVGVPQIVNLNQILRLSIDAEYDSYTLVIWLPLSKSEYMPKVYSKKPEELTKIMHKIVEASKSCR